MPKKLWGLGPANHQPGRHWIYLVGFHDGRVKVGKTNSPRQRISTYGLGKLAWYHVGPSGDGFFAWRAEVEAIRFLADAGTRIRRTETFTGVAKAHALAALHRAEKLARAMPYHRPLVAQPA